VLGQAPRRVGSCYDCLVASDWREYQEEVADFFRSLSMSAETNASLEGVRTKHEIDVVVTSMHAGCPLLWVVECKYWQTRVSKVHVLALREIVSDLGADRGVLLCESGFQSGALEAARLTNVRVTSLADLESATRADVARMRLTDLLDKAVTCKQRYWDIPKSRRIECGLRGDVGQLGYSGHQVLLYVEEVLLSTLSGRYPIVVESSAALILNAVMGWGLPQTFQTPMNALETVEPLVEDLDSRLRAYEETC